MIIYMKSREAARKLSSNSNSRKLVDNGKQAAKRWAVAIHKG